MSIDITHNTKKKSKKKKVKSNILVHYNLLGLDFVFLFIFSYLSWKKNHRRAPNHLPNFLLQLKRLESRAKSLNGSTHVLAKLLVIYIYQITADED